MDVLEYWPPKLRLERLQASAIGHGWRDKSGYLRHSGRSIRARANTRARNGRMSGSGRSSGQKATCIAPRIWRPRYRCAFLSRDAGGRGEAGLDTLFALRMAVAHQPNHTQGRYKAVAFSAFDADAEIAGDSHAVAAKRRIGQAGCVTANTDRKRSGRTESNRHSSAR